MDLLNLLKSNKGTVSSALGKELAQKVLKGDTSILNDAVKKTTNPLDVNAGFWILCKTDP